MRTDNKRTRGRPLGESDIRSTILRIARTQFSHRGYDHTTMRSIAAEADVNPTLIVHYFSSKHKLFLEAVLPTSQAPDALRNLLQDAPPEIMGAQLAKLVCTLMGNTNSRATFLGLLRAATSDTEAAEILHTFIGEGFQAQLKRYLPEKDPLTATLISSQIIGMFVSRYITKIEPIASIHLSELEKKLAIHFQKQMSI